MGKVPLSRRLIIGFGFLTGILTYQWHGIAFGERPTVNVATGKTYSQSSHRLAYPPPAKSTDGKTSSLNNCIQTSETDFSPWWEVDLGRKYNVSNVTIWARAHYERRLYPLNITVDGQLCARVTAVRRVHTVNCIPPIYGQFVRLSRDYRDTGTDVALNLCEVQIWSNVATGKTYSQGTSHMKHDSPSNAANGNTNGTYDINNCIHTSISDYSPWWQVDLGRKYNVSNITIWARADYERRLYPLNITVDGQLCTRVTAVRRMHTLKCISPIYGRVVRLSRDHRDRGLDIPLNLCEVQIWTNVVTGKIYSQSTYELSNTSHSNAANGNTSGRYDYNNCILTDRYDFRPWWQVDLGRKYNVSNITIWAPTNHERRPYPLNITVDGQLCTRVKSCSRKCRLSCISPIYGQVVRLSRDFRDKGLGVTLNLCEVQIWSYCQDGDYNNGTACVPCSPTCVDNQCNPDTGKCDTMCRQEVTQTKVGEISWPETYLYSKASVACPANTVNGENATRLCNKNPDTGMQQWEGPNVTSCNMTWKLAKLNDTVITKDNVNSVVNQLEKMTANGPELTSSDVALAMDTVGRVVEAPDTMGDVAALEGLVDVLSNLVNVSQTVPDEDVADGFLAAIHTISTQGELSDGQLMLSADNLVVAAQEVSSDNAQGLALIIQTKGNDSSFQDGDVTIQYNAARPPAYENSLFLPHSLMVPGDRVAMAVHKDGRVFEAKRPPQNESHYTTRINSNAIAVVVEGRNVSGLEDPIIYSLVHHDQNSGNPRCVYWDETANDWSMQGCSKVDERSNRRATTCQCNHLTNFALLMDVYQHGHSLSETHVKTLSLISYIGCGVSLVAFLLTILIYSLFNPMSSRSSTDSEPDRSQRREARLGIPSQILVNLCTALALSNLVFVVGMHPYATGTAVGCKVVAVLLHFSLLSSMCWMLVEAFNLFLSIVVVFKSHFARFILKCSLVGWGIPLLVVAVTLGVNGTENYGSSSTGMCWLKGIAFYVAFVGPVALILLVNVATLIMVMYRISGLKGVQHSDSTSSSFQKKLRAAVGVTVLLGLTWIFGFLAVSRDSAVVFYYLFALFNCLQGLWIFLFYCVIRKEARAAWLWALPCTGAKQDKNTQ